MSTSFLERAKASRDISLIPMDAPELAAEGEEGYRIFLRRPAVRDSDYASQAPGQTERALRLFIRCARDEEGLRLVQDAELPELMRNGGAQQINALAFRAAKLVAGMTVEDAVKN